MKPGPLRLRRCYLGDATASRSGRFTIEPQLIGELLDSLNVTADLDEGDLVSSAVVVLSVLKDGITTPQLCIANSDGMGWIEQAGLLRLAERICTDPPSAEDD